MVIQKHALIYRENTTVKNADEANIEFYNALELFHKSFNIDILFDGAEIASNDDIQIVFFQGNESKQKFDIVNRKDGGVLLDLVEDSQDKEAVKRFLDDLSFAYSMYIALSKSRKISRYYNQIFLS